MVLLGTYYAVTIRLFYSVTPIAYAEKIPKNRMSKPPFPVILFALLLTIVGCVAPPPPPPNGPLSTSEPVATVNVTTPSPVPSPTPQETKIVNSSNMLLYALIIALVASIPIILDICLAHWVVGRTVKNIVRNIQPIQQNTTQSDLSPIFDKLPNLFKLPLITGLARSTMALALIVIVGITVFLLIGQDDRSSTVSNVITALTTALASITAYYFGTRTSEKPQKDKDQNK